MEGEPTIMHKIVLSVQEIITTERKVWKYVLESREGGATSIKNNVKELNKRQKN